MGSLACVYPASDVGYRAAGIASSYAVRLDKTSTTISISPKTGDLSISYTLEFWIKLDPSSVTAVRQIYHLEDFPPRTGTRGELYDNTEFRAETWNLGQFQSYTLASGPFTGAVWHHVVHGFDAATQLDFTYVDGTLCQGGEQYPDSGPRPVVTSSLAFVGFTGVLDELAIYDKVLTPQRVLAHYSAR